MLNEITIRPANEKDAETLSLLICENAKAILAPHYTKAQWDVFIAYYSIKAVSAKIKTQSVFCSEFEDTIIGTVALDKDFVVGFYTHLAYLNRGIGRLMMNHLEQFALEKGLQELRLSASPVGVSFYLKNGWSKVEEKVMYYHGVGFEETLMRKNLLEK